MKNINRESFWSLAAIILCIYLAQDSITHGPVHLILHEFGHWIAAFFLAFDWGSITINYKEGWGLCTHGAALPVLSDIICIMGVGFPQILGTFLFVQFKPLGVSKVFRSAGMVLYIFAWFGIDFGTSQLLGMPNDFGNNTALRLLLLAALNFLLVKKMIKGKKEKKGSGFLEELEIQLGMKQRKGKSYIEMKGKR
jgi:hypothetical protein